MTADEKIMSRRSKKEGTPAAPAIRDMLFGDLPLSEWPADSNTSQGAEHWASFVRVRRLLGGKDEAGAISVLRAIIAARDLESRHYLQAWHVLRRLGVSPTPSEAKTVLGVVVEVGMGRGVDIVAAYQDRSARYFNFSGAAVVWDRPNQSLDNSINMLLAAGAAVAGKIGPWTEPRPPAPSDGQARINVLTPSGLHFGQGPFDVLAHDPLAAPVLDAATTLMKQLIEKTEQKHAS